MKTHAPQHSRRRGRASTGPATGAVARNLCRNWGGHAASTATEAVVAFEAVRPVAGTAPTHEDKSGKADGTCESGVGGCGTSGARAGRRAPLLVKRGYPILASPSLPFGDIHI